MLVLIFLFGRKVDSVNSVYYMTYGNNPHHNHFTRDIKTVGVCFMCDFFNLRSCPDCGCEHTIKNTDSEDVVFSCRKCSWNFRRIKEFCYYGGNS